LSADAPVRAALARLKRWLVEDACPLWWERGADFANGGYFDRLGLDGRPAPGGKRLRVQARQAHAFALAAELGWMGPARAASRHGLSFVLGHEDGDGLYRLGATPGALDGMGLVYDQAFVLLALATVGRVFGDGDALEARAARLRERLGGFAEPLGGYREAAHLAEPLFANPNMHLFESFQAWSACGGDPAWRELAAGQARLALDRLIDPASGALDERYGASWRTAAAPQTRAVWPGHLYEWAWLLMNWSDGDETSAAAALRLIEAAERTGLDPTGAFAIFALDGALAPTDRGARLWAQTERARALARAAALTGDAALWRSAARACEAVEAFLDAPTRGVWRDWRRGDGVFVEEPAPASSFYHLVGAIAELERLFAG